MITALKPKARNMLFGAAIALPFPTSASAYDVDCAILLCLAGGWPASVECGHAWDVFVQRITPWPIEPPLQIWHCPMGAATNEGAMMKPGERLRNLAKADAPKAVFAAVRSLNSVQELGAIPTALEHSNSVSPAPDAFPLIAAEILEENGTVDIDV
ncbi:hypothetical protein ACOTTU_24100 [Roseobacter sp. EG26]|uniref:hypothetical protein n=1 Tax=Roseobacter sp. EG26 TaxID=3412477 RepID=UPI003CE49AD3